MKFVAVELEVDKYHNKGITFLERKKYEKAIKMFRKAMKYDPDGSIEYMSVGDAFKAMGRKEEARENYEIALKNAEKMSEKWPDSVEDWVFEELRASLSSLGE